MAQLIIHGETTEIVQCTSIARWIIDTKPAAMHLYEVPPEQGGKRLQIRDINRLFDESLSLHGYIVPGAAVLPYLYYAVVILFIAYAVYAINNIPELPPNATNANNRQGSVNNEFGPRTNQPLKAGQRIYDIRGEECRAYPGMLWTYRRFIGGIEHEISYLLLGEGSYVVLPDDVKDGETPVERIQDMQFELYGPGKSPYLRYGTYYEIGDGVYPDLLIGEPSLRPYSFDETLTIPYFWLVETIVRSNEVDGILLSAPNDVSDYGSIVKITADGWIEITDAPVGNTLADRFDIGDTIHLYDCYAFVYAPADYWFRETLVGDYVITAKDSTRVKVTPGSQLGWLFLTGIYGIPMLYMATSAQYIGAFGTGLVGTRYYGGLVAPQPTPYSPGDTEDAEYTETYHPIASSSGNVEVGPFQVREGYQFLINIIAPNGMYKEDSDGIYNTSVVVRVYATFEGSTHYVQGTISTNPTNPRSPAGTTIVMDNMHWRGTDWYANIAPTFTVARLTELDKAFDGNVVDQVQVADIYSVNEAGMHAGGDSVWNPGNATTIFTMSKKNSTASRSKERKLNMRALRVVDDEVCDPDYLGGPTIEDPENPGEFIRNPDPGVYGDFVNVIRSMHVDPYFGRRTMDSLDTDTLRLLAEEINDEIADDAYPANGCKVGYTFDTDQMTYEEALTLICGAVNIRPYQIGSLVTFQRSAPRDVDMILTHRDIYPEGFKLSRRFVADKRRDGVEISYKDSVAGEQKTIYRPEDRSAVNPSKSDMVGQTHADMASYKADCAFNRLQYQRQSAEVEVGLIGRRIAPGMRILVEDCTRNTHVGGEVLTYSGLVLQLSQPVPDGVDSIWLHTRTGDAYQVDCTKTDDYEVTLAIGTVLPEVLYTDWQETKTRYLLWGDLLSSRAPLDMLVEENEPISASKMRLTLTNYDDRYFPEP